MIELRDYQQKARHEINRLLNQKRNPVLVIPTGGGKTKTGVKIIEDRIKLNRRTFVICPQIEIFDQWFSELSLAGLNPGYINAEGIRGNGRMAYVVMPFSLVNILHLVPEKLYPDEILTDELHHSAAASWEKIYSFFKNATRWGLTATPQRTDGNGLNHLYTDIVQTTDIHDLIHRKFLAKPLCIVPEEYHLNIKIKNGDYDPQEQAELLGETKIIGDVIQKYHDIFAGKPVLVACSTFEHAKIMTEKFCESGWKFEHIHSNLHPLERKRMLKGIEKGKINGLCTVGIGIEGLDLKGLTGLIWLRRTLSLTIYLQFIGRVLRPAPGKKYGIILDPVGNTFIHGIPDSLREWSLAGRDQNEPNENENIKMRICPECGVANSVENDHCYFCGCDLMIPGEGKRKLPQMVDGEMVVIQDDGQAIRVREQTESMKQEIIIEEEKRKADEKELITLSSAGKLSVLRDGIFSGKRKIFSDSVKNYI